MVRIQYFHCHGSGAILVGELSGQNKHFLKNKQKLFLYK